MLDREGDKFRLQLRRVGRILIRGLPNPDLEADTLITGVADICRKIRPHFGHNLNAEFLKICAFACESLMRRTETERLRCYEDR